ncbi:hypothetical protein F5X68DRAFT_47985 [Plectosphaerella plurivora]|uniref:Uncharacterized protein n=1 Tax=Plectosphaerella plurivora TaxID=936078 RepID=A0A9P8VJP7_9PEZI|nr:hypothetical protein F5X68DRAFT_47985 [Plectosphaerella plurivora]
MTTLLRPALHARPSPGQARIDPRMTRSRPVRKKSPSSVGSISPPLFPLSSRFTLDVDDRDLLQRRFSCPDTQDGLLSPEPKGSFPWTDCERAATGRGGGPRAQRTAAMETRASPPLPPPRLADGASVARRAELGNVRTSESVRGTRGRASAAAGWPALGLDERREVPRLPAGERYRSQFFNTQPAVVPRRRGASGRGRGG